MWPYAFSVVFSWFLKMNCLPHLIGETGTGLRDLLVNGKNGLKSLCWGWAFLVLVLG